jgi:2-oxoglutarate ferredoxin oxidoreductase subunit beta
MNRTAGEAVEETGYLEYLDEKALPLMWCAGCGDGNILKALCQALAVLGRRREDTVAVTGIGCWGKADDYLRTNAIHGTHGRALAVATGVKAYQPRLTVMALMGDGDCATIGGNHFIHAARRNIGITAVVANNFNYGMTGGQFSATTPAGSRTSTSVYGHAEDSFDLCELAAAAGASFVARTTVYHYRQMERLLVEALQEPGFALVEVVSPCPTYYGRWNREGNIREMWRALRERAVVAGGDPAAEMAKDAIVIGRLYHRSRPSFAQRYAEVQRRAAAEVGEGAEADAR